MKNVILKVLSLISIGLISVNVQAQTLNEDFEGPSFPPNDWKIYDHGDPGTWSTFNGIFHSSSNSVRLVGSTWTDHDDWIIPPRLTITSAVDSIHFWARNSSPSSTVSFIPKVSVLTKDTADFDDNLSALVVPPNAWTKYSYPLAAYNGQDIYFAVHSTHSGSVNLYLDDFTGPTLFVPTCPTISILDTNNLTYNSVELVWDSIDNAVQYTYNIYLEGEGPNGTVVTTGNVTDTTVTVTGIPAATALEVWITTDCGVVDSLSEADGPFLFETPCGPSESEYNQNFDNYLPNCWTEARGQLTDSTIFTSVFSSWSQDGFANVGFSGAARGELRLSFWSPTPRYEWLISPTLNLDSIDNSQISFFTAVTASSSTNAPFGNTIGSDGKIRVVISPDNGLTWADTNVLLAYDSTTIPSHINDYIALSLDGYSGLVKIGFYIEKTINSNSTDFFIDDFRWSETPSCDIATSLSVDSLGPYNSFISWDTTTNAIGFMVEYGSPGFTLGTGDQVFVTGLDTNLTGLNASTDYQFYVTPICSATDTGAVFLSANFTTECAPKTNFFTEDFTSFVPDCWSISNTLLLDTTVLTSTFSNWVEDGFLNNGTTGSARITIQSSWTDSWLVSETINLDSITNAQIEFDAGITQPSTTASDNLSSDDRVLLLVSLDNGETWLSANTLFTIKAQNQPSSVSPGTHYSVPVTQFSGEVKFAFYAESTVSNGSSNFYIDNFEVSEAPTCLPVTTYNQINIADTTAEISWDNLSGASDFIIEYGETGFVLGTGQTTTSTTTSLTITGLSELTTYDFYVTPVCSPTDTADFLNWTTFTTECLIQSTIYTQPFTIYLPNCWEEATGELTSTATALVGTTSNWSKDGYLNAGTIGAARSRVSGIDSYNWLISPPIYLGTQAKQINFDAGATGTSNSSSITMANDDKFSVVISTDDGATWSDANTLLEFNQTFSPLNTGFNYTLSLASYTGNVRIGFYSHSETINSTYNVYVDNFELKDLDTTAVDLNVAEIFIPDTICAGDLVDLEVIVNNSGFVLVPFYSLKLEILGPTPYNNTQNYLANLPKDENDTASVLSLENLLPGDYEIIATLNAVDDINPVNNKIKTNLFVSDFPSIFAGADQAICAGDSIVLDASGGLNYIWNGGIPNGSILYPSVSTDYYVSGENESGCVAYDTIHIDVEVGLPPVIDYVNQTLLTPGLYAEYTWSFGGTIVGTNSTYDVTQNGLYTLTVITYSGCELKNNFLAGGVGLEDINSFDIQIYPNPVKNTLNFTHNSDKVVESVTIYDLQSRAVKRFDNPGQSLDVSGLTEGMYILFGRIDGEQFQSKFTKE